MKTLMTLLLCTFSISAASASQNKLVTLTCVDRDFGYNIVVDFKNGRFTDTDTRNRTVTVEEIVLTGSFSSELFVSDSNGKKYARFFMYGNVYMIDDQAGSAFRCEPTFE